MAVVKKPVKSGPALRAASIRPDMMVQAGLMDDFDGTIIKARYKPWDYDGKIDHDVLAVAVTLQPEEGEPFVQHYSAWGPGEVRPVAGRRECR